MLGLSRYYRLIQGAVLVVLGILILANPKVILVTLAFIVATILIVIGAVNIYSGWPPGGRL